MITVVCYTIYHSPNSYLGLLLAERELAGLPIVVERRPIYVPKTRGVKIADLVGGKETPAQSSYHREDCTRWAQQYGIDLNLLPPGRFEERAARWQQSSLGREELPARAYYAAVGSGKEALLDRALFRAAWVEGLDVNDEDVVRRAVAAAGLDTHDLLTRAMRDDTKGTLDAALAAFDAAACPGVPTWVVNGQRFWGKDRITWLVDSVRALVANNAR